MTRTLTIVTEKYIGGIDVPQQFEGNVSIGMITNDKYGFNVQGRMRLNLPFCAPTYNRTEHSHWRDVVLLHTEVHTTMVKMRSKCPERRQRGLCA